MLSALLKIYEIVFINPSKEKEERIRLFIDKFLNLFEGAGCKLEILIPAGINDLKNDKEIKIALQRVGNRTGGNPLRNWKNKVEKKGYKKFFSKCAESGVPLDTTSIEDLLNDC